MNADASLSLLAECAQPLDWAEVKWRSPRMEPARTCAYQPCRAALQVLRPRLILADNAGYSATFCATCAQRFFAITVPWRR